MNIGEFSENVRAFSPVVVFIDDGFASANLDLIDSEDWASLRDRCKVDIERWKEVQSEHFPLLAKVMDLKRDSNDLRKAWDLYIQAPEAFQLFDPIFEKIAAGRGIAIQRLRGLIEFLEEELHLTVCRHPDIISAELDIKRSRLVFLDFFLYQQSTAERAIEDVRAFRDVFSSRIEEGGEQYNRFLFLISTQLPSAELIESFRRAATVKAAFFKPVPKDSLSRAWFIETFGRKLERYSDLHRLASYLEVFSEQMRQVTEIMRDDLEALELHDLAILDHMRLKEDGEDLGNYMSWLMSEALASRIRASAPMLKASKEMSAVQRPPFHGLLSPNQMLFSWFSEITFGMLDKGGGEVKVQFGDVYSVSATAKNSAGMFAETDYSASKKGRACYRGRILSNHKYLRSVRVVPRSRNRRRSSNGLGVPVVDGFLNRDLVLVIAPACDLQRLKCNYEVLCVSGAIVKQTPNLVDLIGHHTVLGKDNNSGKYKHLLQRRAGGRPDYLLVEWYPNTVTTVPVTELQGTNYSRLARLNELFCHEIKEDALRQVGRVGVPVDPAFNVGLGATISFKPYRKENVRIEIPDSDIISGLITSGNANNSARIIVSEEFIEFFADVFRKMDSTTDTSLEKVRGKFEEVCGVLLEKGGDGFKLAKNRCEICSGFTFQFVSEYARGSGEDSFCGVYFYPRGAIKDSIPVIGGATH